MSSLPLLWPPTSGGIQWSITRTDATSWLNSWAHLAAWHNEHKYVDTIEDLNSDTQQVDHITPPIEQPFLSSLTCHQFPTIETPARISEIQISMAVHVIVETCENFSEPHDMESFIVPHVDKIESPSYVQEDIILSAAPQIRKFNSIHKCFSSGGFE